MFTLCFLPDLTLSKTAKRETVENYFSGIRLPQVNLPGFIRVMTFWTDTVPRLRMQGNESPACTMYLRHVIDKFVKTTVHDPA